MPPLPEEHAMTSTTESSEDDICVSGIAGYFPDSYSVEHLAENLFNKVDLISDDNRRWYMIHPEVPQRTGKIYDVQKFDAEFFGVNFKKAHPLDPINRLLLERVYESLIDAGVNPRELKQSNTGVFVGTCISESEKRWTYEYLGLNDIESKGSFHCMMSNTIAEWLDLNGPCYTVDSACSSSLFALDHAYKAMRDGLCDQAIVCGVNLCLHPSMSLLFNRMGILSADGRCKSFDNRANGYARSESIVACYLQKAKHSKRVYAKLLYTKTNCDGYKVQGITYPASHIQKQLLEKFYEECGISPVTVDFVEAHGTGTAVGDPEELSAIDDIFSKGRNEPLWIGSIKSNLGHSEASSGLNSLAKACIAYNTGYIPPNLNYESPRKVCPSLMEGRLRVATEKLPWNRGRFAFSSFGFGGANAHILLENVSKPKVNNGLPTDGIARLVCVSGRMESSVAKILDDLESRPVDKDLVRLWQGIHERDIPGHEFRGFVLLDSTPPNGIPLMREIKCISDVPKQRPVCFQYLDLSTQWLAIAKQCMILPTFAKAMHKCSSALQSKGVDIMQLFNGNITRQNEFATVGATAVSIGLTDILKVVGIQPDYVIGNDIGELYSAYAEEHLTTEQTILAAYEINANSANKITSIEKLRTHISQHQQGSNLSSMENAIIIKIGIQNYVENLNELKLLKKGNIFISITKENVNHVTSILSAIGSLYLEGLNPALANIYPPITFPVAQGTPMMSHLVEWNHCDDWSQVRYDDLFINKIPFGYKTVKLCMNNDKLDYLTGHTIDACCSPLLDVGLPYDGVLPIVTALGRRVGDRTICTDCVVFKGDTAAFLSDKPLVVFYDTHGQIWGDAILLCRHFTDRVIFPGTGYIFLVWQTFSSMTGRLFSDLSVVFEDVYLQRATNVPKEGYLQFTVTIHENGKFEITENKMSIVTGRIRKLNESDKLCTFEGIRPRKNEDSVIMTSKDFYKELNIRGYQYKGLFRGVESCTVDGTRGKLAWDDNWVTFLDAMLQVKIVSQDTRALYVPTRIEKITIDTAKQKIILEELEQKGDDLLLDFENIPTLDATRAGGCEVRGIHVASINKKPPKGIPVLENNQFVANFCHKKMELSDILRCNLQLIHENIQTYKFKNIELVDEAYQTNNLRPISVDVAEILADLPLVQAEILVLCSEPLSMPSNITVANKNIASESNTVLFIGANLLKRQNVLQEALNTLKNDCFVLSREKTYEFQEYSPYDIITVHFTDAEYFVLLRNKIKAKPKKYYKIDTKDMSFSWIDEIKNELRKEQQQLVLYSQGEAINGLLGLVNCLRREPGGEMVRGLLIADPTAPQFSPECKLFKEHLDKNLGLNVFKNGQWGTYRHLLLEDLATIPATHAYANTATIGDLSSLQYWEGQYSENLTDHLHDKTTKTDPKTTLLHVYSAALNFRDVMVAMGRVTVDAVARGRLAQDCVHGIEVAGRTSNGTRVMGCCIRGIGNLVEAYADLLYPIPDEWTFQEAASVPVAYMTVYVALVMMGKIRRGERILIHAGSGGVGQAAISVALHYGLEVFTTVGTPAKRNFIKKLFPKLQDSHIGNSRDTSFEYMIRHETNGKGVDVVLNSLADDKLQASVKSLRRGGRFLEIGKYDITINTEINMCFLQKEISFHGIMLDYINDSEMGYMTKNIRELMLAGIASGAVRPLTNCSFEKYDIQPAYRYMAAGKHIGKITIKIREEEQAGMKVRPTPAPINAVPRYMCNEHQVFVLVGGLGGFGLELADWLVLRGARKILMCSRTGVTKGYQLLRIRIWQSYGVQLEISTHDVATESGCEEMLKLAAAMGPVKAIFNLAVVLNDAVFENQTPETFRNSFAPKALTTMYLDKLSRTYCPQLKEFVIFSSVSCGRGNAGQTNYGFSNSVMERICEERKKDGLPAVAIQWGAIGDVGLVADMQEDNVQLEIGGTLQQRISSCLQVLDKFLKQDVTIVSSIVVAEKRAASAGTDSIVEVIAQILGISDLKSTSMQAPLSEMGMDSVMAVEIKQTLERDYELFLSAQEIRLLTFAKLTELAAQGSDSEVTTSAPSSSESGETIAIDGLAMMVRNLGDETLASKPYIFLNSNVQETELSSIYFKNILFMIPGIESCASVFQQLCNKINSDTCVLQLGLNYYEDLDKTVNNLYKTVKPALYPGEPFSLLGYSFGSLPVLKLAAKLESEGHKGIVICVDGAPEYVKYIVSEYLKYRDDSELENRIACHSIATIRPDINLQQTLMKIFKGLKTFEEKVKCAIKLLPTKLDYTEDFLLTMGKVLFYRVKQISNLDLNVIDKINSEIVLLRVKKLPVNLQCNEMYGLDKFTHKNVDVHCIDANHANIIDSEECAEIINRVLSEFYNKYEKISSRSADVIINKFGASRH